MAKYVGPKCKLCRRGGEKLFLKGERCYSAKCAMVKRNFPPGQHAQKGYGRLTEYGLQLKEKQKAKRTYGILEKQFRNYFYKANKKAGNTTEYFLQLLESRLDNLVYRAGFCPSRTKARQSVSHGHVLVNNKRVNIPSYQVKKGDKISIHQKSLTHKDFQEAVKALAKKEISSWLKVDKQALTCEVIAYPTSELVKPNFAVNQIIEFYSR